MIVLLSIRNDYPEKIHELLRDIQKSNDLIVRQTKLNYEQIINRIKY